MFNVNVSQLGSVVVKTSERGGLNNEQIADLAVWKSCDQMVTRKWLNI
jgi:hypothetical protein